MSEAAIRTQVSDILEAIAASIRNSPAQFTIDITLVGMRTEQGRGSFNQVLFSGSGSNNIGIQNHATFDDVTVSPAVEAKAKWAPTAADHIHELAGYVGSDQPDRAPADETVRKLEALAVPASLITAINGFLGLVWPW